MLRFRVTGVAVVFASAVATAVWPATAETIGLAASLSPTNEVPPVGSGAGGAAEVAYDTQTRVLTWTVTHAGLSSPATTGHFHGPAAPGENGPPTITITNLVSPAIGTASLTESQAAELMAGRWYLNFHTPAFPGGEMRGQVVRVGQ